MLDKIERLTHGLKEHPFLIPDKLAAIRASRLPQSRTKSPEGIGGLLTWLVAAAFGWQFRAQGPLGGA